MESNSELAKKYSDRKRSYYFLTIGLILLVIAVVWDITDNPPAILSMLLGLLLVLLGIIYFFAKSGRRKPMYQLLYWTPRALSIVFILFVSMFALDVFGEGRGLWQTLIALFMHLIPSFLLIILLVLSWRWEWIAGILYPLTGVAYIIMAWGKPFARFSTLALMAGPPIITGILFMLNWFYRKELREKG